MQPQQLNSSFAIELLMQMIAIESITCRESNRADYLMNVIGKYKERNGFEIERIGNNLILFPTILHKDTPTLLMVSHIDTVPPAKDYSFNPVEPFIKENKVFGLGSNDDGGCVVCMEQY